MDKAKAIEVLENELISLRYDGNISDELNDAYETAIKSLKESESMITQERNELIQLAKEQNITAEELGIVPTIIKERDVEFFDNVARFIKEYELEEKARDCIEEKYWDDLGIRPIPKYQVIEVKLEKRIYRNIKVAIPIDEDAYNVDDYFNTYDLDMDYVDPDDEDDWEIEDTSVYDSNDGEGATIERLINHYGDDIYNRYDLVD